MSFLYRPARRLLAIVVAIVALGALLSASTAFADGDPASDVLVSQTLYLPLGLPVTQQTDQLQAVLAASAKAGFPIRVALIDAPSALGTVTSLWRDPAGYARYLGIELSLSFSGQVLVVMPDGYGVYPGAHRPPAAEVRAADDLGAPGTGAALVTGAIATVGRLAAAAGHPLPSVHASAPRAGASGPGAAVWAAWIGGAAVIALAWGASLRARPLEPRRKVAL